MIRITTQQLQVELRLLQSLIRAGRTTGDRIRDVVVGAHGILSPSYEILYRSLERVLSSHYGEPMMVLEVHTNDRGTYRFEGHIGSVSNLAVELDKETGKVIVRVDKVAVVEDTNSPRNDEVQEATGPLILPEPVRIYRFLQQQRAELPNDPDLARMAEMHRNDDMRIGTTHVANTFWQRRSLWVNVANVLGIEP